MNKWGFIGQESWVALGKSATSARPEVLNLNQGVARCRWIGYWFLLLTHHIWTIALHYNQPLTNDKIL